MPSSDKAHNQTGVIILLLFISFWRAETRATPGSDEALNGGKHPAINKQQDVHSQN